MAFQDEHSPSMPAKVLLSASILCGIFLSIALSSGYSESLIDFFGYEKEPGNIYRQIIMASCSFLYFVRFTICMFIFLKRKISWFEGGLVSFLFFMMFYFFGISAGSQSQPIGPIDIVGGFLFLTGSYINTMADYQRFAWKRNIENGLTIQLTNKVIKSPLGFLPTWSIELKSIFSIIGKIINISELTRRYRS